MQVFRQSQDVTDLVTDRWFIHSRQGITTVVVSAECWPASVTAPYYTAAPN